MRESRLILADRNYSGQSVRDVLNRLQDDTGRCLVIACGRPYPFLTDNCYSAYPTLPNVCVGLQPGDEQCQTARWEEGLDPLEEGVGQ